MIARKPFGILLLAIAATAAPALAQDARTSSNESAAVGALRTIVTAESLYREGEKAGPGLHGYASLEALGKASLIDSVLASGKKQGYLFKIAADESTFRATAVPEIPGRTGTRAFFVDDSGVIRVTADGSAPDAQSPPFTRLDPPPGMTLGGLEAVSFPEDIDALFLALAEDGIPFVHETENVAREAAELLKTGADPKAREVAGKLAALAERARAMRVKGFEEAKRNIEEARKGSNEAAAFRALRTITTAQSLYREGDKGKTGSFHYAPSLEALGKVNLIDSTLASGRKQGYVFRIVDATEDKWRAVATPEIRGKTGDRAFFVNELGVIRFTADGSEPTETSAVVGG